MNAPQLVVNRLPWQKPVWSCATRFFTVAGGRRIRKTDLAYRRAVVKNMQRPPKSEGWYLGPTYREAKMMAWNRLITWLGGKDGPWIKAINEAELIVTLPDMRRIAFKGCNDFDTKRGGEPWDADFDEYAYSTPQAWDEVVQLALADKEGTAGFYSTPCGNNHFKQLHSLGVEGPDRDPNWTAFHFTQEEVGTIPPAELARLKRGMAPDLYRQEILGEFLDTTGLVVPEFKVRTWPEGSLLPETMWNSMRKKCVFFRSIDWGLADLCVVEYFAADEEGRLIGFDEMVEHDKTPAEVGRLMRLKEAAMCSHTGGPLLFMFTVIDKTAWNRTPTGDVVANLFAEAGFPAIPSVSRFEDSIANLRQMCAWRPGEEMPRFMVLERECPELQSELALLEYNDTKGPLSGRLRGKKDHALAAARYAVMAHSAAPQEGREWTMDDPTRLHMESGRRLDELTGLPA